MWVHNYIFGANIFIFLCNNGVLLFLSIILYFSIKYNMPIQVVYAYVKVVIYYGLPRVIIEYNCINIQTLKELRSYPADVALLPYNQITTSKHHSITWLELEIKYSRILPSHNSTSVCITIIFLL